MRAETIAAIASTAGSFALERLVWALETLGFVPTSLEEEVIAIGVVTLALLSGLLWLHLAWKWTRASGWGKPMGILMIFVGLVVVGWGIYALRYPVLITRTANVPTEKSQGSITLFKTTGGELSGNNIQVRTAGATPGLVDSTNTNVKNNKFDVEAGATLPTNMIEVRGTIGYLGRERKNVTPDGNIKMVEGKRYHEKDGTYREQGYVFVENNLTAKMARAVIRAKSLLSCSLLLSQPGPKYRKIEPMSLKDGVAIFDVPNVVPDMWHVDMILSADDPWTASFEVIQK